jgi:hypothetical protein
MGSPVPAKVVSGMINAAEDVPSFTLFLGKHDVT